MNQNSNKVDFELVSASVMDEIFPINFESLGFVGGGLVQGSGVIQIPK